MSEAGVLYPEKIVEVGEEGDSAPEEGSECTLK